MDAESILATSSTDERVKWHPKLTPYRLLVLGTTISVGTAKAILSQSGKSIASTTLEWISGVLIFLIFYIMSTYDDSPKDPPPFSEWLFHIDCMDYLWKTLSFISIDRPSYSSDPEPAPTRASDHEINGTPGKTAVTPYRLLVSFATMCFGLTKAAVTYSGEPTAANWLDWMLGVLIATCLYVLGLYENNSVGLWRNFYVPDYGTEVGYGIPLLVTAIVLLGFIGMSFWIVFAFWHPKVPLATRLIPIPDSDNLTALGLLQDKLIRICLILFMLLTIVMTAVSTVVFMAILVYEAKIPTWSGYVDTIRSHAPWSNTDFVYPRPPRSTPQRVVVHLVLHLAFLSGCGVYLAFWTISIACSVEDAAWLLARPITAGTVGFLALIIFMTLVQLPCAAACAFLMWTIARYTFLLPFLDYKNGYKDWHQSMIFW